MDGKEGEIKEKEKDKKIKRYFIVILIIDRHAYRKRTQHKHSSTVTELTLYCRLSTFFILFIF